MDRERMTGSKRVATGSGRVVAGSGLLVLACTTIGSTCVIVEEGPPGSMPFPEASENEEAMEEQQEEIIEETNR